jgi:hypothetical protein
MDALPTIPGCWGFGDASKRHRSRAGTYDHLPSHLKGSVRGEK